LKKRIRTLIVIIGAVFTFFLSGSQAQAEEVQTPVTVELTKAILPETFPVNSGSTATVPYNTGSDSNTGNVGTIAGSSLGKQLPQTGDKANYWSAAGWGLILGVVLLVLGRKRKDKQTWTTI